MYTEYLNIFKLNEESELCVYLTIFNHASLKDPIDGELQILLLRIQF